VPPKLHGPEVLFDDPCVVFALGREAKAFRRTFPTQQRFPGAPCWARFCGPAWLSVLVVETGVGRQRAERTADWLLGRPLVGNVPYHPKLVLAAGYCGALVDGLKTGDCVLATEVVDEDGGRWPATWPAELPAGRWDPPLCRGRLVTTRELAAEPYQKRALAQTHAAVAVDMETAALAKRCAAAGVPFGCLRTVLDEVDSPLSPRLASVFSGGRVSPWRLAWALVRSPSLVTELLGLAKRAKAAGEPLGKALGELLTLTLPWAAEGEEAMK
jgi:adenosylhomocysteine nucleosidase